VLRTSPSACSVSAFSALGPRVGPIRPVNFIVHDLRRLGPRSRITLTWRLREPLFPVQLSPIRAWRLPSRYQLASTSCEPACDYAHA
jgi:hypothetical protein